MNDYVVNIDLVTGGKFNGYINTEPVYDYFAFYGNRLFPVISIGNLYACGQSVNARWCFNPRKGDYLCIVNT